MDLEKFELPSNEFSVTQCSRFGRNDCQNYLQSIVELDGKTFVCGTDSGNHNCFNLDSKIEISDGKSTKLTDFFHSASLSQGIRPNEPIIYGQPIKNRIISSKIERNDQMSIQMSQYDKGNHKMTKIRETNPNYFKGKPPELVILPKLVDFATF